MDSTSAPALDGSLWWRLFARGDRALQSWACLRGWRAVTLRKKRRFTPLTAREQLEVEFNEHDLALHDVVFCIDAGDASVQALRFSWIRRILEEQPAACESLDTHQRVALHYALAQCWEDLDQLSWLVAKSQRMLLRKDAEGCSLMAQALSHKCPQEIVMLMAVDLACRSLESVEALVEGRHFESARRLCHRMVCEFFAGVPHFPHAFCLQLLRHSDVLTIIDGLQSVWRAFVDKWGYYGVPVVVNDLPLERHVPLDSFLQIAIKAKGEPLAYQWFCDDEPISGATQATLFVSQCAQPHNEGVYYCEVTNWKGRVVSTTMRIVVVDDKHGPDPSLRYLLSDHDRLSLGETDVVHRVAASRGGLVMASLPNRSVIMEGCSLLLPPKCFSSFDANGVDVSDVIGMDAVVRQAMPTRDDPTSQLSLARSEKLVSAIVEVIPFSVPALAQPAILSIPICWCSSEDPLYELVVVEIPVQNTPVSNASASSIQMVQTARRKGYVEVDHSRVLEETAQQSRGIVSFEISRFGRFAVLARSVSAVNKENDKPLEDVVLCVTHPRQLSTARELADKGAATVSCSIWLVINRPDAISALQQHIQELRHRTTADDYGDRYACQTTIRLQLREGHLLHLRIGRKETISHVWRGARSLDASISASAAASKVLNDSNAIAVDGVNCLREEVTLASHELVIDPHDAADSQDAYEDGTVLVFRTLELSITVLKPSRYQSTAKPRGISRNSSDRRPLEPDGVVLSERDWKIHLPVIHDLPQRPAQPSLHQRRPNQLALAYYTPPPVDARKSTSASRQQIVLFEELHETEREFSPYFYQLELARFADTFWQRYDRTWWFDKTKSDILLGMFRVAHSGTEPFTVIASDAFAGAIRVVQSSLDTLGAYSEPYLLEPVAVTGDGDDDGKAKAVESGDRDDDEEDEARIPSGLRRVLTLAPSLDLSPHNHASLDRLRIVLDQVYGVLPHELFTELCGVALDFDAVRVSLERQRDSVRAANCEVALLVLAMDRLSRRMRTRILLRSKFYTRVWVKLRLLRRLVPEVDCFPEEHNAVTIALHTLVRDLFEIAWACSSPGWFARFLRNEWFETELQAIISRALRLLHTEAQTLQGADEITEVLDTFAVHEDDGSGLDAEHHSLVCAREYVLLVLGQPSASGSDYTRHGIATLLRQFIPPSIRERTTLEDWEEQVTRELQSDATARALHHLREHDMLTAHVRSVSPQDQERFHGSTFPTKITFRFGVHVVFVDTQHALKVTNATLRCGVQGQTQFSREHKRLEFVPALPFEKHTRYKIKLRAQYIHTTLGGALPPATSLALEFSTAA